MTCPDPDTLAAIGSLSADERAAIADHAASCETCRGLVQGLLGVERPLAEAETLASGETPPLAEADTLASGEIPPEPDRPARIDRYRIDRRIGAGAMGIVYAAYDPELARPVAIKVLRAGGSADRMRREAQALAKLTHPNVVAVHDVGEHAGATFVTMALVDGENLRDWLARPRTTAEIIGVLVQAARGVEAAHRVGIVHRDLKPDNIFVARTGEVLVGDFGLARSGEHAPQAAGATAEVGDLTQTGAVVGTPAYMAPEQIGGEATVASDQFALCVTAWEALYGARPFTGTTLDALARAMRAGPPDEPATRKVPAHVRAAIRRGLAADPAARHPSVSALLAALSPRRRRWPYAAAMLAIGAAVAGVVALREDPEQAALARCEAQPGPAAWSADRRAHVLARVAPPAAKPAVASALATVVDRYATAWTDLARTSCIAAARRELSEPVYATMKRCLDRRAATLAWTLEQTIEPFGLLGIAETLEPIETCRTQAADAPPSAELAALQRDVDRGAAFVHAVPARAIGLGVDTLVARAQQLNDPATLAEASYLNALALHAQGRDPVAELRRAIASAEQARDDRIRTRASALLAVITARTGRFADAKAQLELATSASSRAVDWMTTLAIERANAALAHAQGDLPGERAALQRIESLLERQLGERSLLLVDARFQRIGALQRAGDPAAPALLDRVVAELAELADAMPQLVLEQASLRERVPARKVAIDEQIVALARRETPARLPELLEALGYSYEVVGDYERALAAFLEARSLLPADAPKVPVLTESAATMAFDIAERTDDEATRRRRLDEALAFVAQLPPDHADHDGVQTLRGRILVALGRYLEAVPQLTAALAAAERADEPHPYRIAMRSFALAQALWEVGGARDRDRARALAAQAAARIADARAMYEADRVTYGAQLERVARQAASIEAWRRRHP